MADRTQLARGERAPDFVLPDASGTLVRYYARAGGQPAVLAHGGHGDAGALEALVTALGGGAPDEVSLHIVGPTALASDSLGPYLLVDAEAKVAAAYRTEGQPTAFVLDENLRVRAGLPLTETNRIATAVQELHDRRAAAGEPRTISSQAPVLLIDDVLDPPLCAELMDVWEREGNVETGVEDSSAGSRSERVADQLKRRRDHTVSDPQLMQRLVGEVGRRVMPELRKAFNYRATRFEGFKIARYDDEVGGFFRPHRDNLSPTTAHRRFALTLNLNDGYAGGELRFPEYGLHRYRPDAGGALVFSCAHLHEVLEVTAGERYVLLSFLFGEEARPQQP